MRRRNVSLVFIAALTGAAGAAVLQSTFAQGGGAANGVDAARYSPGGELIFPADADRWVALGAGIGSDYSEEPFDPQNPGAIGVVQMEPAAYEHFLATGRYADGTMLLLTFYAVQQKPEPALQGFVQGDVLQREIHVIDRQRFPEEQRAFFLFPGSDVQQAAALPQGSRCVECHTAHGDLDATFIQFYPALRQVHADGGAE
ncbi:MAG: cytochrome P460 family protein [Gammaproteobacteria bacterium]|nr:cytochrome P460 family protein [Gammaproteobacteria bacterium]